jgi:hypothetical protein
MNSLSSINPLLIENYACLDDDLDVYYRRTRSENDISEYKEQVYKAILRLNFQTKPHVSILSELRECYNCCPSPSPVPDYDADIDSSDFGSLDLESDYIGSDCN